MSDKEAEALLGQAQKGERPAFDRLHRLLEERVRGFFRRLVGYSTEEDARVQEAFVALYLNLGKIQSAQHLLPFLFRVVRQRSYDAWRRRKRHERLEGDIVAFNLSLNPGRSPDDQAHWALLLSQVRQEIDRLPENQRQTLILHFEEGMTYEQVGEALNIDTGTVKSRIFYGRKALRRRLGDEILASLFSDQA